MDNASVYGTEDCRPVSGVSPAPRAKRAMTLDEIIELAKRKASTNDYCIPAAPSEQDVSGGRAHEPELPVEQPATPVIEMIKVNNDLYNDNWSYVGQLMEPDSDHAFGDPPSSLEEDENTLDQIIRITKPPNK
ncbi:unnamed protein product [Gongylonema pulchrum]|uniref:SH3 domain-containing protein n=1 Tax=Gongylonema pulchrum TaxID=637853 RepID=A0A183ECI7_9BILA|nr:unnamed protein product [Gongylonema pulchrum]